MSGRALIVLFAMAAACLPADDRPEPGRLLVSAVASEATRAGLATEDGWLVRLDRLVAAVGQLRLTTEAGCNAYSAASYTRLFDFTELEREKVGLVHGLGHCSLEFDFRAPEADAILGAGASADDSERMRIRGSDPFAVGAQISVIARGEAVRGETTRRFEWLFRRRYEIHECAHASGEGLISVVELAGGEEREIVIEARAEELFRAGPYDEAPLLFATMAAADADDDGDITLEEMVAIDAPRYVPPDREAPSDDDLPTLAALIYERLLPRLFRVAGGGACTAEREG